MAGLSAEDFFASARADYSLGDIVAAPTALLWTQSERPGADYAPAGTLPMHGEAVQRVMWEAQLFDTPGLVVEARYCPAMIVADDCALDKELNATIARAVREGADEAVALDQAVRDQTLDPLVPVVPILPYTSLRSSVSEQAVRDFSAVGFFHIFGAAGTVDEGYVDFIRSVPVSRQHLADPLVALSNRARQLLRWKLVENIAARHLSVDGDIRKAIGKCITDVRTIRDNKTRLVISLELNGGEDELLLQQYPRTPDLPPEATRSDLK